MDVIEEFMQIFVDQCSFIDYFKSHTLTIIGIFQLMVNLASIWRNIFSSCSSLSLPLQEYPTSKHMNIMTSEHGCYFLNNSIIVLPHADAWINGIKSLPVTTPEPHAAMESYHLKLKSTL
jgi:hypothetical protein